MLSTLALILLAATTGDPAPRGPTAVLRPADPAAIARPEPRLADVHASGLPWRDAVEICADPEDDEAAGPADLSHGSTPTAWSSVAPPSRRPRVPSRDRSRVLRC